MSYEGRPVEFAREVLGATPWERQEAILNALRDHSRVTVCSAHGIGKTWVGAAATLWFLYTREPVIVLTTAPTHRQVKEVLWREIRRQHRRMFENSRLPEEWLSQRGEVRETALRLAEDRYALGLTTDEPDRFQGFHSPHVLVIVDEASGVEEPIFDAIDGVLTGAEARLLLIGNPLHSAGRFYDSHRKGTWKRFSISAKESPNVKGRNLRIVAERERPAEFPGLVTARWVWERRQDWGKDSPLFQSRVLGRFPDQATDALIRLSWIEEAIARGKKRAGVSDERVEAGADIARFGGCESVLCIRQGPRVLLLRGWRDADLSVTRERLMASCEELGVAVLRVDAAGMGAGVADELRRDHARSIAIVDCNGGRRAHNPERYGMERDEWFFGLRERFRVGDIVIPDDAKLREQLAALTYSITPRGQQSVVSKDELAARGTRSPDRADALALAFAAGPTPLIRMAAGPAR
jgi:hypothetical protein